MYHSKERKKTPAPKIQKMQRRLPDLSTIKHSLKSQWDVLWATRMGYCIECQDRTTPPWSQHANWQVLGHPLSQVSEWGGMIGHNIPWANQDIPIPLDLNPCNQRLKQLNTLPNTAHVVQYPTNILSGTIKETMEMSLIYACVRMQQRRLAMTHKH